MKNYGKTKDDIKAEKSLECRKIVKEIMDFGVNESQKLQLIKLIALELESNPNMKKIINTVSEISENKTSTQSKKLIGV
tara:strand:- start:229 stop:465 length:237 start_codon:yes stop_codon:yes gene_type:complete